MKYLRERFPIVAVLFTLLVNYAILVWNYQTHNDSQPQPYNSPVEHSIASGSISENVKRITADNDIWEKQNQTQKETRLEKSKRLQVFDYYAQINMAIAAWIGVFLGIFGAILLFFTLRYTRDASLAASKTLEQATKATNAAISALQNDRAWIAVNSTPHSVVENFKAVFADGRQGEFKKAITFQVQLKNIGRTPAQNVRCELDNLILPKSAKTPKFTEEIKSKINGALVGAGTYHTKDRVTIYGVDADKLWAKTHVAYIIMRCEYQTVFDDQIRYTTVVFKFHPEGSHIVDRESREKFYISQVGEQRQNT